MITLNIFSYDKQKIKEIQQEFYRQRIGSKTVNVISNKKIIYTGKIHEQKLISLQLSPKLITAKQKIIDLGAHQINTGQQPDQQYFIKQLFNNFLIFLISGYIEVNENIRMDLIYLFIHMQIQEDRFSLLLKKIQTKYYDKLWEIILLVFKNLQKKKYRTTITKLIENNPTFLIDLEDQREINKNFFKLESIHNAKQFLKFLYAILNKKNSPESRNQNHIRLIDILFKQFIFRNELDKKEYKKNIVEIVPLINPQNENEILIKQIQKKQQEIQEVKNKQYQQSTILKDEINQYDKKINKLKNQIEILQQTDPSESIIIKNCNPIHHIDFPACKQTTAILLQCNHRNCIECSSTSIHCKNAQLFVQNSGRKIESFKIKCLNSSNKCEQIFTNQRFEILKNYIQQRN